MSCEIDENNYSLQTRKQRIRGKKECCQMCVFEAKYLKRRFIRKISLKKGSDLVSKCMDQTFPELSSKIQFDTENDYLLVPGCNTMQINEYDFYSDVLDESGLNKYQKKIVYETMKILKFEKDTNTVKMSGGYSEDNLINAVRRCNKSLCKQRARRDL